MCSEADGGLTFEAPSDTCMCDQAGIEGAGATACRRTFAVRLHSQRYDLRQIREVLGLSSLQAKKDVCESDPVSLGRIVARVI